MSYENMRRRDKKNNINNNLELATVTSPGEKIAAVGFGEYRDISLIGPYGISWNPPVGSNIQLLKNWNSGANISAIGSVVDDGIEPGEIKLYSEAASIHLKNDGNISISSNNGADIGTKEDGSMNILSKGSGLKISNDGSIEMVSGSKEIRLGSNGGSNIVCEKDGSVLINKHFKINPDGTTERI